MDAKEPEKKIPLNGSKSYQPLSECGTLVRYSLECPVSLALDTRKVRGYQVASTVIAVYNNVQPKKHKCGNRCYLHTIDAVRLAEESLQAGTVK